jgi:predicted permease
MALQSTVWHEVLYSVRRIVRSPGVSFLFIVAAAIGVAIPSLAFSIANNALFKDLGVDSSRLVSITLADKEQTLPFNGMFLRQVRELAQAAHGAFGPIVGAAPQRALLSYGSATDVIQAEVVTGDYFDTLHVKPLLGRLLNHDDDDGRSSSAIVVSERFWRSRWGARPDIVGTHVHIGAVPALVVGVVPDSYRGIVWANVFGYDAWFTTALAHTLTPRRLDQSVFGVIARPSQGVGYEAMDARLAAISGSMNSLGDAQYLSADPLRKTFAPPLLFQGLSVSAMALAAVIGFISFSNVVVLVMVRTHRRAHELAIRSALGASHADITRLLGIENAILTMGGGCLGLAVTWLVASRLGTFDLGSSGGRFLRVDATPDWQVAICAVVFTVAGAMWLTRSRTPVRSQPRGAGILGIRDRVDAPPALRLPSFLLATEVTLSVSLVVISGILVANARTAIPSTMTGRRTLVGRVDLGVGDIGDDYQQTLSRLSQVDAHALGFEQFSVLTALPISGNGVAARYLPVGAGVRLLGTGAWCRTIGMSGNGLTPLGLRLIAGRSLSAGSSLHPDEVLLNESAAAALWPGTDAIGRRLRRYDGLAGRTPWLTVVGIVRDTDFISADVSDRRYVYVPLAAATASQLVVLAVPRATSSTAAVDLRTRVAQLTPTTPIVSVHTVDDELTRAFSRLILATKAVATLAALASLLTVLGLYGAVAHMTTAHQKDLAIMRGLGAPLRRLVLAAAKPLAKLLAIGFCSGLVLAWLIKFLERRWLFRLGAPDTGAIVLASMAFLLIAFLPALLPVLRCARADLRMLMGEQ